MAFHVGYVHVVKPDRDLIRVDKFFDLIDQALALEREGLQDFTGRDPFQDRQFGQFFVLHRDVDQVSVDTMAFGLPVRAKHLFHGPQKGPVCDGVRIARCEHNVVHSTVNFLKIGQHDDRQLRRAY